MTPILLLETIRSRPLHPSSLQLHFHFHSPARFTNSSRSPSTQSTLGSVWSHSGMFPLIASPSATPWPSFWNLKEVWCKASSRRRHYFDLLRGYSTRPSTAWGSSGYASFEHPFDFFASSELRLSRSAFGASQSGITRTLFLQIFTGAWTTSVKRSFWSRIAWGSEEARSWAKLNALPNVGPAFPHSVL